VLEVRLDERPVSEDDACAHLDAWACERVIELAQA
jgi:hypothetical protein